MNILYIGSSGALSLLPFETLIQSCYSIRAVGVYQPIRFDEKIIALENESLALAAQQQNIAIIDLSQSADDVVKQCKQLAIDVILMSCYGRRLADSVSHFPALGCFNMHPSLLPLYRGPEPIFWQMKHAAQIGVSWHRVTSEFDAGDVVAQKSVLPDDGDDYLTINVTLAKVGSELMLSLLAQVTDNSLSYSPQDAKAASYYHYPQAQDFFIDTADTAQDNYNFMRATSAFDQRYRCILNDNCYLLDKAIDYDYNDTLVDVLVKSNTLYIPCKVGVLVATFTAKM